MGISEYLSQSNNNVDSLDLDEKFKYIDNWSIIERINLIMHGLSSYNFRHHVASDIDKTKYMIINYSKNYQSNMRLKLEDNLLLEQIVETKLGAKCVRPAEKT